jgi:hypothetical protein
MPDTTVWLATVTLDDGTGYSTIHRTRVGAEAAILDWYASVSATWTTFDALDDEINVVSFSCSEMPIYDD